MDPGHLDHGGHRLTMHPALEYSKESWLSLPGGVIASTRSWRRRTARPQFFLCALFLHFRRLHGLRKRQHQRVAVVGLAWSRFCMSVWDSSTNRLLRARMKARMLAFVRSGVCTNPKLVSNTLLNPSARRRS
jgi:hypothetical protein